LSSDLGVKHRRNFGNFVQNWPTLGLAKPLTLVSELHPKAKQLRQVNKLVRQLRHDPNPDSATPRPPLAWPRRHQINAFKHGVTT